MEKQIYTVDSNGFINNTFFGVFNEAGYLLGVLDSKGNLSSAKEKLITIDLPQPMLFHKPKWNGAEWVEGESEEERIIREEGELMDFLSPSQTEIAEAELEIKLITLLMEMEVI